MSKYLIALVLIAGLLTGCGPGGKDGKTNDADTTQLKGSIKVIGSQTLYPMMVKWSSLFIQANKQVGMNVRGTYSGTAIGLLLKGETDIAMISRPLTDDEKAKGLVAFPVAMDVVVPIISFENKQLQPLVRSGVDKERLAKIFKGEIKDWSEIAGRNGKEPIVVCAQDDSSGTAVTWYKTLGIDASQVKGNKVISEIEMINFIKRNPGAIGYTSMVNAYDLKTGLRKEGLYILPIDYSGDKNLQDNELYYDKYTMLTDAVFNGRIPSPPARELYVVTKGKPTDPVITAFLQWILTTGQNYMPSMGYQHLKADNARIVLESLK